jgi:hypothetical protein
MLLFGKGANPWTARGRVIDRAAALKVLEDEQGVLPLAVVLRCRLRAVMPVPKTALVGGGRSAAVRSHFSDGLRCGSVAVLLERCLKTFAPSAD